MISYPNFDDVKASGDFEKLPAGGYVIVIRNAEENEGNGKPYINITYDIAEGEKKGFFNDTDDEHAFIHQFRQYHSEKSLGIFKGFITKLDECNGTNFAEEVKTGFDVKKLIGKKLGVVIGYEHYVNTQGNDKESSYIAAYKSISEIHEGKFNVPELRERKNKSQQSTPIPTGTIPAFTQVDASDIPF